MRVIDVDRTAEAIQREPGLLFWSQGSDGAECGGPLGCSPGHETGQGRRGSGRLPADGSCQRHAHSPAPGAGAFRTRRYLHPRFQRKSGVHAGQCGKDSSRGSRRRGPGRGDGMWGMPACTATWKWSRPPWPRDCRPTPSAPIFISLLLAGQFT